LSQQRSEPNVRVCVHAHGTPERAPGGEMGVVADAAVVFDHSPGVDDHVCAERRPSTNNGSGQNVDTGSELGAGGYPGTRVHHGRQLEAEPDEPLVERGPKRPHHPDATGSDQRRQEWNRDKLRRSLQVACTKRPISAETIERTVEQIEAELRSRDTSEVPSSVVGDLAMEKLRHLDQVAYIRFASVYRAFADISSFEDEVRRLIERAGGLANGASAAIEPPLASPAPGTAAAR